MAMNDWATRKMAIDVIYTLAAILKEVIIPFKGEILEVLNHSRFDKYKPVREATIEAYHTIKNLGGDDETEELEQPEPKSTKNRSSLKETIRAAKRQKGRATQDTNIEILDKSDNDRKISAATQKRLESKRVAQKVVEEKKDTGPISYDDVKSNIFKGPKNRNFFKKQKKKEEDEIQIFTKGDHKEFDYEEDLRRHQEKEVQVRKTKAADEDFGVEMYESKKQQKHNPQSRPSNRYQKEDHKVRDETDERQIYNAGVKEPEDVPVHIYVKGKPLKEREENYPQNDTPQFYPSNEAREIAEFNKAVKVASKNDAIESEDVQIDGEEYETSMNLLKQHQEMMKRKMQYHEESSKNEFKPAFEIVGSNERPKEEKHHQNYASYSAPQVHQYRVNNYQPPISSYQTYSPPTQDLMLQKRIEQFTQQMTSSMNNLQSYVRSEMAGIKQRLSYLESKVETISRRQNELDLERLNQSTFKHHIEPSPLSLQQTPTYLDTFSAPNFDKEVYQTNTFSIDEKPMIIEPIDDWNNILSLVQQDKLNLAYSMVLKKGDDMLLFKLMGRTGVCLDKLDDDNLEKLLRTIAITLNSKTFVDLLLPWMKQFCKQYNNLHPVVQNISITKSIEDCFYVLLTDTQNFLDQNQKDDVELMYNFIKNRKT
jgi:hypothetical protein